MNFKSLCPEDVIKISSCISLAITEKFNMVEISIIKNLLCLITSNLSAYQTQQALCEKPKSN